MATHEVDLCVLGAGPAGFAGAMRAHDLGKRVALVERGMVGGTGLRAGVLASKTMWHLANDFATTSRRDRGYVVSSVSLSFREVIGTVEQAIAERQRVFEHQLARLAAPSPKGGVVTTLRGEARVVGPGRVEVRRGDGSADLVQAANVLVATGSRPRVPPGVDVDGERILTSDHVESLADFPESLVILGAGVVGCEYATVFANFGRTRVRILDRQARILPFEDADVAEIVTQGFRDAGVHVHRSSKLESLRVDGDSVEYVVTDQAGASVAHRVERALVSVGRVPNTDHLGLVEAGVALEPGGGVAVDGARSRTAPWLWAAGDVTADVALANVAELEARHAVEAMFGLAPAPIHYEALSAIMFLCPEVASCGLGEQAATKAGIPYRYAKIDNRLVGRNVAMRATRGFVKLLAERDSERLLGLRVVGPQASSTIQGVAFLIERGGTLSEIDHTVHPHPAMPEGVQECARMLLGRSVLKPEVFADEGLLAVGAG